MADGGIQSNIFIVKHDGSIGFLIDQKTAVQELVKVSGFFTSGSMTNLT